MEKNKKPQVSTGTNGYDLILQTYNSHKYPVIENQINAVVYPESMMRDVDSIDPRRFYEEVTSETEEVGVQNIPASPINRKRNKSF